MEESSEKCQLLKKKKIKIIEETKCNLRPWIEQEEDDRDELKNKKLNHNQHRVEIVVEISPFGICI